jgi:hypothetical protein
MAYHIGIAPVPLHGYAEVARRDSMRPVAFAASIMVAFAALTAWAQNAPAENDDTRYSFNRIDEGYLRLDGRTGQVSVCVRRAVGWACQTAPDERAALEAEIARLQSENALLKKELLARNLPLPGNIKPDQPPANPDEPILQLPNDADLNKVMTFIEKVWRRFVEMIVTLQKDILKKT